VNDKTLKLLRPVAHASSMATASLLEAAREIAIERRNILDQIRDALQRDDEKQVVKLAKVLCGINDEREEPGVLL
jgi:uncharacterized protein YpiB (UPF0302 family)